MKNTPGLTFMNTKKVPLAEIERRTSNNPVNVDAKIEDLFAFAAEQNFVSVVDDNGIFIGIVLRNEIIRYCLDSLNPPRYFTTANIKDPINNEVLAFS